MKLSNTGWTQVEVPLATLASEDEVVDGLWVQNASGTDLPKFYVTEIRLQQAAAGCVRARRAGRRSGR